MYSKILIPLDGSKFAEAVLPYARLLAQELKIPVDLLCVNDPRRDDGMRALYGERILWRRLARPLADPPARLSNPAIPQRRLSSLRRGSPSC